MNLTKEKHCLQITAYVVFDARTALNVLSAVFMPNGHHVLGSWCKSIETRCFDASEENDKWLAIPCGGMLVFHTDIGDVELDMERFANGFKEWYENVGHRYVPLRMNANGNLQFDAYGLRGICPDEIDPMMQTCLFGFVKFDTNVPSRPVVVMGKGGEKAKMESAVKALFNEKETASTDDATVSSHCSTYPKAYLCNKCVKERLCDNKRPKCPDFKRDPPDGGFYG